MDIKLVADSSANISSIPGFDFVSAPLKIVTGEKEYVDDGSLDTLAVMRELQAYKGRSSTACPGVGDWLECFGEAETVLGVSITGNLSGAYNSGRLAAEQYMEEHPGRKAYILDSLSTGPEMHLILEKYAELAAGGMDFDSIVREINLYLGKTRLYFCLESVSNLAKNGRVSHTVAAAVGILGIRIVGRASNVGTLEQMHKCRGEKKGIAKLYEGMLAEGFKGGKVRISHSDNEAAAEALSELIRRDFPQCELQIYPNGALCCFYSEAGGILVGFETE